MLIERSFDDLEFFYPYFRLLESGVELVVASSTKDILEGLHGYPIKPDATFEEVESEDYDGVVMSGGYLSPAFLRANDSSLNLVKRLFREGKIVASICIGSQVLISAGILKGKKATGPFVIKDDIINAGAEYSDQPVVVDGNLITGRQQKDLPYFMKEVVDMIKSK